MTIFDSVIFGVVAVLISLKVILLAAAAVLFVSGLTAHIRQRKAARRCSFPEHPRLNLWA